MTARLPPEDVAAFAAMLAEMTGVDTDKIGLDKPEALLRERLAATGCSGLAAYRRRLFAPESRDEYHAVVARSTVGETYFFREPAQLELVATHAFPERARARGGAAVRVLSVACSSGEEPYSLAMLLKERGAPGAANASIIGVDINHAALERARRARYGPWSMRVTPDELRDRYFRGVDGVYELNASVRSAVTFEDRSAVGGLDAGFWAPGSFDIIFCRNMLIYLTPDALRSAIARFERALVPGGYLFLGASETLRGLETELKPDELNGAFFFRRPSEARGQPRRNSSPGAPPSPVPFDAPIHAAAARLRDLASPSPRRVADADVVATPRVGLDEAFAFFLAERFDQTITAVDHLPAGARDEADARLLRVVACLNLGDAAGAEHACRDALARGDARARFAFTLALCAEHRNDIATALYYHGEAARAEPQFAFPRLRLGALARRDGDEDLAWEHLSAGLRLLYTETQRDLALFGGGFGRASLIQMCQSELDACSAGRRR